MAVDDAILSVLVEARGVQQANREIMSVDSSLKEAHRTAERATAAVAEFGRSRGTAVLAVDASAAHREAARATREVNDFGRMRATATLDVDASRATAGLRAATAGMGGAAAGANGLRGSIGPLSGSIGVLASAALFLGAALLAIVGPAFAVLAALGPLVGLAAGAAGGLVTLATAMGVVKLATMGVADALKEQVDLARNSGAAAAQQASQQQSAGRAITSALESVRGAREGARRASEALAEAERREREAVMALGPAYAAGRRWLADMGDAARGSALALDSARQTATQARQALRSLLDGPSPRILADAHRDVDDAVRGESDAVRQLTDARRALEDLIRPADALDVADAQDRIADATREQERAQAALAAQVRRTNAIMASGAGSDAKAEAQRDLADAQNRVGDAARDATRAARVLAELQAPASAGAVAAAQARIASAQADVTRQTQATADARAALASVEQGASDADVAAARLEVARADQAVTEASREAGRAASDWAAAQAAGVEQSPAVVSARESVRSATMAAAQAERAHADAIRQVGLAHQGVRDAQMGAALGATAAAAAATAANEKFNALPPSAQRMVRVLQSLRDEGHALRTAASDGFMPGAEAGLLAAARSFEPVRRVIAATASVLGDLARRAGELVGSGPFGRDMETIGTRNAKVLDTLGSATLHVVSALRHVLVVAGPLTQWLANVADKWALNAAESAKAGRESGKMAAFFERTIAVAQRVGSIIANVTGGLMGMGRGATDSGNSILLSIDRASQRFNAWANSVGGQNSIRKFFEETRELAAALVPAIANLASGFATLILRLLPLTAALAVLGPYADEAIIAFIGYKVAVTAAAIATGLHSAAVWLMGTRLGAAALYNLAWRASAIASTVATTAMAAAQWLLNAALTANPIGLVVVAVAALVAGLVIAYRESETFRAIIDAAFAGVVTAFGWIWQAAQDVFGWLKANWPLVLAILTGPIGLAALAIAKHWDTIKATAGKAWDTFKGAAEVAWNAIKTVITAPIQGAVTVIGAVWTTIKSAAGTAWEAIKTTIVNPVRSAFRTIREDIIGPVVGWLADRWSDITGGVRVFGLLFGNTMSRAFGGAANAAIGFVNAIIRAINKVLDVVGAGKINPIDKLGVPDRLSVGDATKAAGLARGGAFARTGGVVSSPITLMGEEAPTHPEYVIPTNPAYRGRAHALLMQAAGAIGLAEGGVVSAFKGAIKTTGASAKPSLALFEAGIVESGLRNLPYGDRDSLGALQVRAGIHGADLAMSPLRSALAFLTRGFTGAGGAIGLSTSSRTAGQVAQAVQGSAFPERYDAAREQAMTYLGGKDDKGGILGSIGNAVGTVGGVLGDLLSKGAGFLLDMLPSTDKLPDWLKGTGKFLLDKVGDWIGDTVGGFIGGGKSGGSGPLPGGVSGGIQDAIAFSRQFGDWTFGPGQLYRPGGTTYHGSGRAVDFGDAGRTPVEMRGLYGGLKGRYGDKIRELFWDPAGEYVKDGNVIGRPFGGHKDHIHLALARGGMFGGSMPFGGWFGDGGTVPGPNGAPIIIGAHGGETVSRRDEGPRRLEMDTRALDRLAAALERIADSGHAGAIDALADVVNERVGFGDGQRRATSANPTNRRYVL